MHWTRAFPAALASLATAVLIIELQALLPLYIELLLLLLLLLLHCLPLLLLLLPA
jgi:hypothetical protein